MWISTMDAIKNLHASSAETFLDAVTRLRRMLRIDPTLNEQQVIDLLNYIESERPRLEKRAREANFGE